MKKLYTLLASFLITLALFAQAPEKMSYQAVVRDANNALIMNQAVGMRIQILQGSVSGTTVYEETQTPTSNDNGLVTLEIGTGTIVSGMFGTIDWSTGPYFIKTETDPNGATNYTISGTSQLMSVPYALYAKTSGNGAGPQGLQGDTGLTGPVGPSGANGINGFSAYESALAADSTIGLESQWLASLNGADGVDGNDGTNGAVGAQGPAGTNGIDGTNGNDGATGPAGADGTNGVDGTNGNDGADGATGAPGLDGVAGATGLQGATGNAGSIDDLTDGSDGLGTFNVFLGENSGISNLVGGSYNVGLGNSALRNVSTGTKNTALGHKALNATTTSHDNTGLGREALMNNQTGKQNTAVGAGSLLKNDTDNNTAIGYGSMYNTTSGGGNVALGMNTLTTNETGANNVVIGLEAGYQTTGSNNVFIGSRAGYFETGSNKLYIDNSNTSTPLIHGDFATKKLTINGSLEKTGALYDASNDAGTIGQILSTTVTGTDWVDAGTLTGPTGATGATGAPGPAGADGTNGNDGATGANGNDGVTGATGLLTNGTAAGNTPYWDGSQWIVNNSNILNNGTSVGIGTTSPNASAKVEIESTTQGFLPPRMTVTEREAITAPAVGLVIYNTTSNCLNFYAGSNWHETCGSISLPPSTYPNGSIFCASGATVVVDVTNPTTGEIWMDRNLGASQVATSSTDANSYGDLYQWGRRSDGHQCRTSGTTSTLSSVDQPAHGDFIIGSSDWRSSQNTNLWQGVNGVNNPCPIGYRLPTETEITAEMSSWSSSNSSGAFASPLKLPLAGYRHLNTGSIGDVGTNAYYWQSTLSGTSPRRFGFESVNAGLSGSHQALGFSVRCIKD